MRNLELDDSGKVRAVSRLPELDRHAEDESYFYFGWVSVDGGWLVRRQARATAATQDATETDNSAHSDLDAAWAARATLTYAV